MPEIADVVPAETITDEWGNSIRDRTVQRYADVAERASEHPTPAGGDLSYIAGTGAVEIYHSGSWQALVPVGVVLPFAGSSAPTGYLFAQGQAVSRSTYAELFALIGTTFGAGDGSTTFNLPDMRQRFPLGKAASGTGSTLGAVGGSINHDHSIVEDGDHSHTNQITVTAGLFGGSSQASITNTSGDHDHGGDTGAANPPYLVLNYIIKAL